MRILIALILVAAACGGTQNKQPPAPPCNGSLTVQSDIVSDPVNKQCDATDHPFVAIDGYGTSGDAKLTIAGTVQNPTIGTYSCSAGELYIIASDPSQKYQDAVQTWSAGVGNPPTGSCTLMLTDASANHVAGHVDATLEADLPAPPPTKSYTIDFSINF